MTATLLLVIVCVAGYSMLAKRLATTVVTAPIIFLCVGFAISQLSMLEAEALEPALHLIAEIALIVVLFTDAAKTNLRALSNDLAWPVRMLLLGLPLAVLFGTLATSWIFPDLPLVAAALIAAILAPTDAALGQAVVTDPRIPIAERRTLVVESGLNDGLALPVILFFACTLATIQGEHQGNFAIFTAQQLILGPTIGAAVGWLGARALLQSDRLGFTEPLYEGITAIAFAGAAYLLANLTGGNGFIAVFCAGLAFGHVASDRVDSLLEFAESEGQMLVWAAFLLIGMVLVPHALASLSMPMFALVALSLFLIRPLAIWLSLIGAGASAKTKIFLGWFGPRGLATALFALLVVGDINQDYADSVLVVAVNAVWISALVHGMSAAPIAARYAKPKAARATADLPSS